MSLVRSHRLHDADIDTLSARLAELETTLTRRAAQVSRVRADLAAFRIRYHQEVGRLHEELDELNAAIADAEIDEAARQQRGKPQPAGKAARPAPGPAPEALPRFTSDAVRKLFREVARIIHPDLAADDVTRGRRHSLMIEANRAYALGDEERLRSILEAWENSPDLIVGSDPASTRERLLRRVAQLEAELAAYDRSLADFRESPLWRLKMMVDDSSARGIDLVADTVRRLKRDIMVARQRFDAIQWRP